MEEIKAGDIMLGNYIQSPYGNYPIAEIGYKDDDAYIRQKDCHAGYYLSYCRPIPLTEDVLLKCGFKKDVNGILWIKITPDRHFELINSQGYYYPQLTQLGEISHQGISAVSLDRIQYVHELQNILRCLTKTELIVEL